MRKRIVMYSLFADLYGEYWRFDFNSHFLCYRDFGSVSVVRMKGRNIKLVGAGWPRTQKYLFSSFHLTIILELSYPP
jgi:hypothetical protein